jgi:hypothetical protein
MHSILIKCLGYKKRSMAMTEQLNILIQQKNSGSESLSWLKEEGSVISMLFLIRGLNIKRKKMEFFFQYHDGNFISKIM